MENQNNDALSSMMKLLINIINLSEVNKMMPKKLTRNTAKPIRRAEYSFKNNCVVFSERRIILNIQKDALKYVAGVNSGSITIPEVEQMTEINIWAETYKKKVSFSSAVLALTWLKVIPCDKENGVQYLDSFLAEVEMEQAA